MAQVRQAKRAWINVFFIDPLVGLVVGFVCFILWILPLPAGRYLGAGIGTLAGLVSRRRNQIALKNMSVGLPDVPLAERKKIVRKMWQHFGMLFADVAHGKRVLKESTPVNIQMLRDAQKQGKGGFVCSAHFGNWELDVAKLVGPDFPLDPVYRKANNPWLNKLMFERRTGVKIPKGSLGARMMLECLNRGDFIAILCDQKLREGMEIPFFGKPAMTATGMVAIAIKKDVPIFLVKSLRNPDKTFTFSVEQKVEIPKGLEYQETLKSVMTTINNIYWSWIKKNPEQYLWIHRRFDKSFYLTDDDKN